MTSIYIHGISVLRRDLQLLAISASSSFSTRRWKGAHICIRPSRNSRAQGMEAAAEQLIFFASGKAPSCLLEPEGGRDNQRGVPHDCVQPCAAAA
jgi:hypothetical protein